jgi:hypothetical protein
MFFQVSYKAADDFTVFLVIPAAMRSIAQTAGIQDARLKVALNNRAGCPP